MSRWRLRPACPVSGEPESQLRSLGTPISIYLVIYQAAHTFSDSWCRAGDLSFMAWQFI